MLLFIFVYALKLGWKDFTRTKLRYMVYPLKPKTDGDSEITRFSLLRRRMQDRGIQTENTEIRQVKVINSNCGIISDGVWDYNSG